MILKNHTSASIRKEKLSPTSKAKRKASRNKFVKKSGMPNRVESLREVDCRIVQQPDLGMLNPSETDYKRNRI